MYVPQNWNLEMPGKGKMLRKPSLDVLGLFSYHSGEERAERDGGKGAFSFHLVVFGLIGSQGITYAW